MSKRTWIIIGVIVLIIIIGVVVYNVRKKKTMGSGTVSNATEAPDSTINPEAKPSNDLSDSAGMPIPAAPTN
jgi:hypothetical protein